MLSIVDVATMLAIEAHHGHENPHDGEPYLLHCQRVAVDVRNAGWDERYVAVAWMHDGHEDWPDRLPLTLIEASFKPFGQDIATDITLGVEAISKRKGETITEYLHRCKRHFIAATVKPFDRDENFRRIHNIEDVEKRARMAKKYSESQQILGPSRHNPAPTEDMGRLLASYR